MLSYFGTISGLNKLHQITRQGGCKLRVDLGSWDGHSAWAEYRLVEIRIVLQSFENSCYHH